MEKVKWGIIAPGRIANSFAQGINVVDNAELYAVGSSNLARAKEFCERYNCPNAYGSYDDLLNDNNVNAIYIANPHRYHFNSIINSLNAGKHVLCEKPITVNFNQANEAIELAKKNNLFLMEAVWTRYLPIYKVVKKWIADNKIGEIKLMSSNFGIKFPVDFESRIYNHQLAGGVLLDLGIYPIAVSQFIKNENPTSFTASALIGKTNVDEIISVNMQYSDGSISQFTSNLHVKTENPFIIYGTEGYIKILDLFSKGTEAELNTENEKLVITEPIKASGFEYEIEEASSCILRGELESSRMSHKDTLANMKLMDDIRNEIGLKYDFE